MFMHWSYLYVMQRNQTDSFTRHLKHLGIHDLNPMQKAVIEKAVSGIDLLVLAPTGTGKTLAFLIPLISQLDSARSGVQAMVVSPSRELALQIEAVFRLMKTNFRVVCCYGGHSMQSEQNSLKEGPAVIIGTPGRLSDHILRKSFDVRSVKMMVVDEFDKCLQMGFHEPLRVIFKALGGKQQHILTSATNLDPLPDFLSFIPEQVSYLRDTTGPRLQLKHVITTPAEKTETLLRLVGSFQGESCLVFCNHREAVDRISTVFKSHRVEHGFLHGAMEQVDREKNLIKFRGGAYHVLIATDLASRGLDIPEIKHIVHYQLPPQEVAFLHRNGRTARMQAAGTSYLILATDEPIPHYVEGKSEPADVPSRLQLPPPPQYACLYISAGKKDKISKGDIVGLLTKKGQLPVDQIGLIATLDRASFVCIQRERVDKLLASLWHEKLKSLKVKIERAT